MFRCALVSLNYLFNLFIITNQNKRKKGEMPFMNEIYGNLNM